MAVARFKISTSSRSLRFSSLAPAARAPVNPPVSPNAVAAMTAIARMEKTEFVERLNTDLGTEFQSIVQYVQHVATIKGAEYRSIAEELGNHLAQELEHATILATQIDFLGGTPTVQVPPVRDCPDAPAALQADLELEERQLQRYRDRVAEAGALGLPDVAEALRPLLEQTQDHVIELRDALGK
jgi:bacterioferritin